MLARGDKRFGGSEGVGALVWLLWFRMSAVCVVTSHESYFVAACGPCVWQQLLVHRLESD
jgi:hypothetical protein